MRWRARGEWESVTHDCPLPTPRGGSGSIWRCDCGTRWKYQGMRGANALWQRLTPPRPPRINPNSPIR